MEPPIILPIVTGNKLFRSILDNEILSLRRYPKDRYDILATLCSKDKATKVNIGINIRNIFSTVVLAFDDKYTARHTKKLHKIPKIKDSNILKDILLLVILTILSSSTAFSGVLIINKEIIKAPHRFPK